MKTITVELDNPIPYAGGNGEEVEGSFIEIKEPTGKIAHLVGIMKAEIGAATKESLKGIDLSELTEGATGEASASESGEAAFTMLTMGNGNMERVMVTMKEILRSSADIGGEKAFTAAMFDKMTYNDVEKVLKEYIGNFIAA